MVTKAFIQKLFNAAYMQRWNDKYHPVEFTELDKQAHKMIIAFLLANIEEGEGNSVDWDELIKGGIFEFLQRIELTDLKPPIYYRIKNEKEKYSELNKWVYERLYPSIAPLGVQFCSEYQAYFEGEDSLTKQILAAAHFYTTNWEFQHIKRENPDDYEIPEIEVKLQTQLEESYRLSSIQTITLFRNYQKFIDICGRLRFQSRWSNVFRIPRTSVLGHMLIVAILSYLFASESQTCARGRVNNYFTGLFHDLPEALTRDIITPVKKSVTWLDEMIKQYEREQMDEVIYPLLPDKIKDSIRLFTENEFANVVHIDDVSREVEGEQIRTKYNEDKYNPRDGELVKACDTLAALNEAYITLENGINNPILRDAVGEMVATYQDRKIGNLNIGLTFREYQIK